MEFAAFEYPCFEPSSRCASYQRDSYSSFRGGPMLLGVWFKFPDSFLIQYEQRPRLTELISWKREHVHLPVIRRISFTNWQIQIWHVPFLSNRFSSIACLIECSCSLVRELDTQFSEWRLKLSPCSNLGQWPEISRYILISLSNSRQIWKSNDWNYPN
jgi:hypothetical protein